MSRWPAHAFLHDLAHRLDRRLWGLLAASIALLAGAHLLSGGPAQMLISAAMVLAILAFVLRLVLTAAPRVGDVDDVIDATPIDADPGACVISDAEGNVALLNAEARRLFGEADGATLSDLLRDGVEDRAAVLFRLRARAGSRGSGQEDLHFRGRPARLSVRHLSGARLLWRLDCPGAPGAEVAEFSGPPNPGDNWDILESLHIAYVKIAANGQVMRMNPRAASLLGCDEGVGGLRLSDLVEGLGRPVADWLEAAAKGQGASSTEVVRARRPERETYLQVSLIAVDEGDEVVVAAVLNDATELKTLEAQFVQSQKMQAIGQLAGGVAHDFNNLLTAISGYCDLLLLRHDIGDPDYGDLQQIAQNANRAASLVGQLLAFSRKQNLRPQVLDLRDLLDDLTHLLNRLVGEKTVLSLQHDPGLRAIRADRRQLEQVIMNLVVNARDAMRDTGGEITVATANLSLRSPEERDRAKIPPGDYVRVTVTDTGSGIPADRLQKIFEPFYTTKKSREGTGLGLSTAYGIVKQTGGFIFADSVVGRGTTFSIYLPAASAEEARAARSAGPEAGGPTAADGRRIEQAPSADGVVLLVEDEAPVRAFASHALRLRGYTVLEAANAEEALFMLEDDDLRVDLFVSDVIMPGMDGPSWVRKALEKRPGVGTVFVSGYAEESFSDDQRQIPNCVFLPKPFSLAELTRTVGQQLG